MSSNKQNKKLSLDEINNFINHYSVKQLDTEDSDDEDKCIEKTANVHSTINSLSNKLVSNQTSSSLEVTKHYIKTPILDQSKSNIISNRLITPTIPILKTSVNLLKKEPISNPFSHNLNKKSDAEVQNPLDPSKNETSSIITKDPNQNKSETTKKLVPSEENFDIIEKVYENSKENLNLTENSLRKVNLNKDIKFISGSSKEIQILNDSRVDLLQINDKKDLMTSKNVTPLNEKSICNQIESPIENKIEANNNIKQLSVSKLNQTTPKPPLKSTNIFTKNDKIAKSDIIENSQEKNKEDLKQVCFENIYNDFQRPLNDEVLTNMEKIVNYHLQNEKIETVNLSLNRTNFSQNLTFENKKQNEENVNQISTNNKIDKSFSRQTAPGHFSLNKLIVSNEISGGKNLELFLDKNYFPLNYGESSVDNLLKIKNLIQRIVCAKEIKLSAEEHSLITILNNFFFSEKYNMTLFRSQGASVREDLLRTSNTIFSKKNNFCSKWKLEGKETDKEINTSDLHIEKLLEICFKRKNFSSLLIFSLFAKKEDINQYIYEVFEESPDLKDSLLYVLFMIKSGKISKLITEKGDKIIDNFYLIISLIAKNFSFLDEINIELFFSSLEKNISANSKCSIDKYLILKLLNKNFNNYNVNQFKTLVISFLKSENNLRILIIDIINYLFYINLGNEKDDKKLNVIAFSSILMKLKYVMYQSSKNNSLSTELINYCDKILEKKEQFGHMSKNDHFVRYISSLKLSKSIKSTNSNEMNKSLEKTVINETTNSNQTVKTESGIKSILSSFGLFSDSKKKPDVETTVNDSSNKSEGIRYDPILKRYLINGEVPKDDNPVQFKTETKKLETKTLPPPIKAKTNIIVKPVPLKVAEKNEIKIEDAVKKEIKIEDAVNEKLDKPINNGFIDNPFSSQRILPPKIDTNKSIKKPVINNIALRYASAIDKK